MPHRRRRRDDSEHGCPNCKASIDLAAPRCPHCGVFVEEWLAKLAWEAQVASTVPRVRRQRRSKAPLWAAAGAAGLALAFWRLAAVPEGLALPPDARADPDRGVAFVIPPGWQATAAAARRPASGAAPRRASVASLTDGFAFIEVKEAPASVLPLAREKRGAEALLAAEFGGTEPRLDSVEAVEVDRLPAVRLRASGPRTTMPSPNRGRTRNALQAGAPAYESMEFRGLIVIVPGADAAFLIKIYSNEGYLAQQKAVLDAFLTSFRVTRRPAWWRLL